MELMLPSGSLLILLLIFLFYIFVFFLLVFFLRWVFKVKRQLAIKEKELQLMVAIALRLGVEREEVEKIIAAPSRSK